MHDAMLQPPPQTEFETIIKKAEKNIRWRMVYVPFVPNGITTSIADMLIVLLAPSVECFVEAVLRIECADNMHRLALAVLLYQVKHGKLSDENWAAQIEQYLGNNPEQYFSCPSNPSAKGHSTYALVQYGDAVPEDSNSLLLVELKEAVPFGKAVISTDEILENKRTGSSHSNGMNTADQGGTVRFLSNNTDRQELLRLLGRK